MALGGWLIISVSPQDFRCPLSQTGKLGVSLTSKAALDWLHGFGLSKNHLHTLV